MKAIFKAFIRFISGIWDDFMLVACLFAPILMGLAFRFGITALEKVLCDKLEKSAIIAPYYLIFDLLLIMMTPVMFSFSGVMTMLDETDNGTAQYLMVTPLGKTGYIMSRIGIPSAIAAIYSIVAAIVFGISGMNLSMILVSSILSGIMGTIVSMLVIAFAKNKVEGMALVKLSGILFAGIPAALFVTSPAAYFGGILPSFWLTKLAQTGNFFYAFPAVTVSVIWMILLYDKFSAKLR